MKSIFASNRVFYLLLMSVVLYFLIVSCNEYSVKKSNSTSTQVDSTIVLQHDSLSTTIDTSFDRIRIDSSKENHVDRSPASVPDEPKIAKGIALVYCPTKMIRSVPSIVNAAISKEDLTAALTKFEGTIQQENPELKPEDISRDTRNDTINLYDRMEVKIEFDPDDFVQIGKDDEPVKEFGNQNMLEWEWEIKPKQLTRKSIINFKFYYVDPDNKERFIMEKVISVAVKVDARSYVEKLGDLFFTDFKTGLTTILIPLFTFFGGLISGRRKKN